MNNTYNGITLVGSLMECRITEKTTLEITINGEKQESITVSKNSINSYLMGSVISGMKRKGRDNENK